MEQTRAEARLATVMQGNRAALASGLADGVVLLYHNVPPDASTIMEHVGEFQRSRFPIWPVNTDHGYPPALDSLRPRVIALHYSLFGTGTYAIGPRFRRFLREATDSYKVAFFQDEHQHPPTRSRFIDEHAVDCVYTLLEPAWHELVYGRHASVHRIRYNLPGYVSDQLVETARRRFVPDEARTIDVGYRGRSLAWWQGRGSQEKRQIGLRFRELAIQRSVGLRMDIGVDEAARLYGGSWTAFLAQSRAFLGVEAGVSVFDLEDRVRPAVEAALRENPALTFEEVEERFLAPHEDRIFYRTVSPRHFEAAAFRVLQVLFEGRYSGVLEAGVHYVPLKKDFSNFDDVVRQLRDPEVRRRITDRAYEDLIASGRWSYRQLIADFDATLEAVGLCPPADTREANRIARALVTGTRVGRIRARVRPWYRRAVPLAARLTIHDIAVAGRDGARGVVQAARRR